MCSFRDLDSAAAAAAARMDSCKFEVEVTEAGVLGAGVLGGDETTLESERREASSLDGELSPSVQVFAGLCKTIIFSESADFAELRQRSELSLGESKKKSVLGGRVHQPRFGGILIKAWKVAPSDELRPPFISLHHLVTINAHESTVDLKWQSKYFCNNMGE